MGTYMDTHLGTHMGTHMATCRKSEGFQLPGMRRIVKG